MDEDELSEPEDAGCEPEDEGCEPEDSTPALDVGSSAPEEIPVAEELSSPPVTGAVDEDSSPQASKPNESVIAAAAEVTVAKIEFFFMISSFN